MTKFIAAARKFVQAEEGATMVEYGVMVALIAAVCIAAVTTIGKNVNTAFNSVGNSIAS